MTRRKKLGEREINARKERGGGELSLAFIRTATSTASNSRNSKNMDFDFEKQFAHNFVPLSPKIAPLGPNLHGKNRVW